MQRAGKYAVPPQASKILGVEFSGTVEKVGEGATGFKEGEKVFGLAYGGVYTPLLFLAKGKPSREQQLMKCFGQAYAEFIAVSEKMCMHMPDELSYEQAAGLPEVCSCGPKRRRNIKATELTFRHRPG